MGDALQSHIYPGMIHQGEHGAKPTTLFTDQLGLSIIKDKLTGWRAVNAQLFLDPRDADMIAPAFDP